MRNTGRAGIAALGIMTAAACGGSAPAGTPASARPSAALPADVRAVAAANSPAPVGSASPAASAGFSGEFVSSMQSEVGARIPGRVARVYADEGQRVRRGQALLQLETEYLQLDVRRAQAELARATALRDEAEREFNRKKELLAKGSVAPATYERAQSTFEQAQAGRDTATAALDLAKQRLGDAVVTSPVDGVVVQRLADAGERLGDGSVVFVVAQTAPLKLRFRIPERYVGAVREGRPVRAHVDPYPNETFEGKVAVVGGSVDPQTRTLTIEAAFPNRDGRLKPGLFARVELDLQG